MATWKSFDELKNKSLKISAKLDTPINYIKIPVYIGQGYK